MFNVIVSGSLDNDRRGSILAERVFEYTDDHLLGKFFPDRMINRRLVMELPTLFMTEGISNEVVRIGWLSAIDRVGNEYQLKYSVDRDFPSLTNSDIFELAQELQLHQFEFSRNHWAVKDVDLFQVLYRGKANAKSEPKVFKLSENPVDPKLISFMMPFSAPFTPVYSEIKTALEAQRYRCQRADDFWLHAHIMSDVIELMCTSSVIVCDLTDKNPNVFYEAGIAHTLGKEVILITQSRDDVPFDLRPLRYLHYLNNNEGRAKLAEEILARVQTIT